jgi:G3E family GTPase
VAARAVPVVLVAGRLGAGKTTLVNHLLRHADGRRVGVVVNDFGAVEVDALLVAGRADALASLAGGCLCCEVDANGLADLLATLTAPRSRLDLVVVEASGLAEPRELVRMLLAVRGERIAYGGLVLVVDAAAVTEDTDDPEIALADLVVLNRTDRAPDPDAALARVRSLAAGAVLPTTRGAVDPALLAGEARRAAPVSGQLSFDALLQDDPAEHAHARHDRVTVALGEPLDPRRLVTLLESGLPGVYRAKGFVRLAGEPRVWEVQTVGTALEFRPAPRAVPDPGGASLVLLGAGLDAERLVAAVEACRAGPEPPGEHAMLPVLRHVP